MNCLVYSPFCAILGLVGFSVATGALLSEVTSSVTSSRTGSLKVFMATGGSTGFSFLVGADSKAEFVSVKQALDLVSERHSFDFLELDRALVSLLASLMAAGILIFSDYARSMFSTTNEISVVSLTLYEPAATVERRKYPGPALSSLAYFSTVFSGFLCGSETAG